MPGMSVRIISHASTEPRGTDTSTVKKPQIKEFFSGPHSTAFAMVPVRMYFQ